MRLSRTQIMLLHVAAQRLGIAEPERRIIQRNVGGFFSAADRTITRQGFIAVMAFYEERAGGDLRTIKLEFTAGYWKAQNELAQPTDSLRHLVRARGSAVGMDAARLDAFIAGPHMSSGSCAGLADASAYWLGKCLEAIKAMRARMARGEAAVGNRQ